MLFFDAHEPTLQRGCDDLSSTPAKAFPPAAARSPAVRIMCVLKKPRIVLDSTICGGECGSRRTSDQSE
jgi:hypothetical protein